MKILLIITGLLSISLLSFAAETKVATILCSDLSETNRLSVEADLFGTKLDNGFDADHATIRVIHWDEANRKIITTKEWEKVLPAKSGYFSLAFANETIRLEAWFDDVGALSSLQQNGQELQLACDYDDL